MTFQNLKGALRKCATRLALRELVLPYLEHVFGGEKRGVFFFDEMELSESERLKFQNNPVVDRFLKTETGLYESMVVENAVWRAHCPRADHGHVLVGPLVAGGCLVGMVAVTRAEDQPGFAPANLAEMNRLCLFVSSRLSEFGPQPRLQSLTDREKEIALLASQGFSNASIASDLVVSEHTVKQHLKGVFRKLEIRSRSELAWLLRGHSMGVEV